MCGSAGGACAAGTLAHAPGLDDISVLVIVPMNDVRARVNAQREYKHLRRHPPARAHASPGRVCLIGEHTDYNDGLALAMAIAEGVTVDARRIEPASHGGGQRVRAQAIDLGESDEFALSDPSRRRDGAHSCGAPWPSFSTWGCGRWARACASTATCRAAPGCPPRRRWRSRLRSRCSRWPARPTRSTGPSSRSWARAWRTSGRARGRGCSTS